MEEKSEMIKEMDKDYEDYCDQLEKIFLQKYGAFLPDPVGLKEVEPVEPWKKKGSQHYKCGKVEPIDLYKSGMMFQDFALCSIIKYAFRNRRASGKLISSSDMDKIIHYAEILKGEG